jgi:YfiR/HmsC-like
VQAAHIRVQFYAPALAALLSLVYTPATRAQTSPSVEYQVKAALLFNIAKFVEWPPDVFKSDTAPITICVLGNDPFGSALDDVLRGKTINNREILARRVKELPNLKRCQVVFISETEDKQMSEIINSLKGSSTLTVGESKDFAERGGEIQFYVEENKVRFSANVDAVQRARLIVSSKLLALARIVHDQGHTNGG